MSKKKSSGVQMRSLPMGEIRLQGEDGENPVLVGYAAVFNSESEIMWGFREIVRPGAFKKTLQEKADIRALIDHNPDKVLARTKSGTLICEEDDHGLRVEIELDPGISYASDLLRAVKRGDVDQMSFGFRMIRDKWDYRDGQPDLREILEAELFDVSPVTYPAYQATELDVRNIDLVIQRAKAGDADAERLLSDIEQRIKTQGPGSGKTSAPDSDHAEERTDDHPNECDRLEIEREKRKREMNVRIAQCRMILLTSK